MNPPLRQPTLRKAAIPAARRTMPLRRQFEPGIVCLAVSLTIATQTWCASADDWPQWMGPQRDNVWREKGVLEKFPPAGPEIRWRVPVNRGYCGPAVVGNRVFLLDRKSGPPLERKPGDRSIPVAAGNERVLCLNASTGSNVWEKIYDCPYRIGYPAGPRATPVVSEGRVYTLGAMGDLLCLDAKDGKVIWERHFLKDFELADPPTWGYAAHPLLDGERLICLVGGTNSAMVAFNKDTGKELWRAVSTVEIGYAPPIIQTIAGKRQLVFWHPDGLAGLEPESGKVLWTQKYPVEGKVQRPEVSIATPRVVADRIFTSSFYHGALMLQITNDPPGATVVWDRHSTKNSEFDQGLHTVMCTPIWKDGHIYGICGMGELRCLDAKTGDRVWESDGALGGKTGFFGNAFLVEHGEQTFIWNDQGELILARLTPKGFEEISRAKLLETSENTRGRDITWCQPAFANRCAYVHNGKEFICISLAATNAAPGA
jgi:outer membrane protein assembly factor BamB